MEVLRSIRLKFCVIEQDEHGVVWTTFDDGTSCPATAHEGMPHYHVISHRVGNGDDVHAYAFFHEAAHCFVEEKLHGRPSRVLWGIAHGEMLSGCEAAYEEIASQVFQRWVFGISGILTLLR